MALQILKYVSDAVGLPFQLTPGILAGFVLSVLIFLRWRFIRAQRALYTHVPGPKNSSVLGYLPDIHKETSLESFHYQMPQKFGHVAKLSGAFLQKDALYVCDPAALHAILVKNQHTFIESTEFAGLFGVIHHGNTLGAMRGGVHKRQRRLITPIFTAAAVSKLTPLFYGVAYQLRDKLMAQIGTNPEGRVIDILDNLGRTALELIAQGGVGHTFDSFSDSGEYQAFHEALTTVLPNASRLVPILPYLHFWRSFEPVWVRRALASSAYYIPWPAARKFKKCLDTMHPVVAKVFRTKKQMIDEGRTDEIEKSIGGGNDLASLLMAANAQLEEEDRLSDETVTANMSSLFLGGQETTSGSMARLLWCMVNDKDLQARVRKELNEARAAKKNGEELDYNELNALPLLDGLCREALRVFAPVTFVWRETMEDCVVPLHFPIIDPKTNKEHHELLIQKGTPVYVGLAAANRSQAIWGKDADKLQPDRWIDKDESTINQVKLPGILSNVMTFLGGGRACPGMKYAFLEMKLVMSIIIPRFEFLAASERIDWRLGITVSPYVNGDVSKKPSVPLRIRVLDKSEY